MMEVDCSRAVTAWQEVAYDVGDAATAAADRIATATTAPHVLMRPRVYPDGKAWCALYGENIQDGVAGFGDTPAGACADFDARWRGTTKPHAGEEE